MVRRRAVDGRTDQYLCNIGRFVQIFELFTFLLLNSLVVACYNITHTVQKVYISNSCKDSWALCSTVIITEQWQQWPKSLACSTRSGMYSDA